MLVLCARRLATLAWPGHVHCTSLAFLFDFDLFKRWLCAIFLLLVIEDF
jgi:hypothetical protein